MWYDAIYVFPEFHEKNVISSLHFYNWNKLSRSDFFSPKYNTYSELIHFRFNLITRLIFTPPFNF